MTQSASASPVRLALALCIAASAGCDETAHEPVGTTRESSRTESRSFQDSSQSFASEAAALAWLGHYGYSSAAEMQNVESARQAIRRVQEFHGLRVTGELDEATKELMRQPRCGLGDIGPEWAVSCAWASDTMRYAFDGATPDISKDAAHSAVRRAFGTYAKALTISFVEVQLSDSPGVIIRWVGGKDSDFSFSSTDTAHADYPPECRKLAGSKSSPMHFNDCETCCRWSDQPAASEHDIESVALHEIGHLLGLKHSRERAAAMFPELPLGQIKRGLHPDDLAGLHKLYPNRMR